MVLPHYMGRSDTDIQNKIYRLEGRGISREDSFSSQSPPDDVPLLLPPEANGICYSETSPTESLGDLRNGDMRQNEKQENQPDLDVLDNWWETQERGYQVPGVETSEIGPLTSCCCQVRYGISGRILQVELVLALIA